MRGVAPRFCTTQTHPLARARTHTVRPWPPSSCVKNTLPSHLVGVVGVSACSQQHLHLFGMPELASHQQRCRSILLCAIRHTETACWHKVVRIYKTKTTTTTTTTQRNDTHGKLTPHQSAQINVGACSNQRLHDRIVGPLASEDEGRRAVQLATQSPQQHMHASYCT